jgi:ubiquinone/menaquinone biosynthesis C-methylase UbiE
MLDVGPRTAAGTGLIGYMHNEHAFSRIKIKTTAIDIDGTYVNYAKDHFPLTKYIVGDVYKTDFPQPFDVVLTSHTIEHVPNPKAFLDRLKALSSGHVLVACPFGENELIPGHINRFTDDFFKETQAIELRIYSSIAWVQSKACIAVFKGTAKNAGEHSTNQRSNTKIIRSAKISERSV